MKTKRYVKRAGDVLLLYPYRESVFPFSLEQSELGDGFGLPGLELPEEGRMYEVTITVTLDEP